ncbi:MAG: RNA methyltransferase [Nitrospirota bacterium]|nr:RNA methyltransferase [Nitrospirota bacterium]
MPFSDKVAVVLVEPQKPVNIGMVCRAMKNMGFSDLRLVNPCDYGVDTEAQVAAVSARDILDRARVFPSLAEALADISLSVATTRRLGQYRKETMPPGVLVEKMVPLLAENRAALVFGREDRGLFTEEVALCRWRATIPTAPDLPSLNLAQAVLLFCYELQQGLREKGDRKKRTLAKTGAMEGLFGQMEEVLSGIGFLNPQNPDHQMHALRGIFNRAELDEKEVHILRGIFSQVEWAAKKADRESA